MALYLAGLAGLSCRPRRFYPEPGQDPEIAEPQEILDRYLAEGPQLLHVPGDRADYHPASDTIRLPQRSQFRCAEDYYATAFHEAGHSTGHPDRLNRPGIAAFDHFGSGQYAREELAAQMTSSLLCAQTGIDNPEIFDNSASYIAGWLSALNNDHKLVITAAAQAQRACDLINQLEREPAKPAEHHLEAAPTSTDHIPAETTAAAAHLHQAEPERRALEALMPSEHAAATGRSQDPVRAADWQAEIG
jgi:antirestriction protein ArdC